MKSKIFYALFMMFAFACLIFAQDRMSSFVDERDGQTYRAVVMPDGKTWMAQNLNFATESGSWCYNNYVANCEIYGRLYDWETAMTACPQGWRLPSDEEWGALINAIGGAETAGKKLKSQSGWAEDGNGTDEYGFSALPGGNRGPDGSFGDSGYNGYWWTADDNGTDVAYNRVMYYNIENVLSRANYKSDWLAVRCIRED